MPLPIKAVVVGGAALAIGGTGIWYAFSGRMPDWKSLDQDGGFSGGSSGYSGKYADSYARFLTGMGTAVDNQTNPNDAWWKWSFNTNYSPDKDKGGFTNNNQDLADAAALKAKCDEAYKSDTTKIKSGNDDLSSNEFKEDKLWKFCSFNGVKPKTVQEVTEEVSKYTSKIGDTNKATLLSVESKDNGGIWTRLDSLAQEEASKIGFFFNGAKGKNIGERCKHAYEKATSLDTNETEDQPSQTNLYKWCSAKGKTSS